MRFKINKIWIIKFIKLYSYPKIFKRKRLNIILQIIRYSRKSFKANRVGEFGFIDIN